MNSKNNAVIWRGTRKDTLIKRFLSKVCWGKLYYLIIDKPHGTSDEHLSIVKLLKLNKKDAAIIVKTPQDVV